MKGISPLVSTFGDYLLVRLQNISFLSLIIQKNDLQALFCLGKLWAPHAKNNGSAPKFTLHFENIIFGFPQFFLILKKINIKSRIEIYDFSYMILQFKYIKLYIYFFSFFNK